MSRTTDPNWCSLPYCRAATGSLRRSILLVVLAAAGCGIMDMATGVTSTSRKISADRDREEHFREQFVSTGDPKAIRWLLRHCIDDGMKVEEVGKVLGQDGERERSDRELKSNGGYHLDDVTYRWGPDTRGRTYFLMFRNGRLVNFDPQAFESLEDEDN